MSYTDFTLDQLHTDFGIKNKIKSLFLKKEPIEPSDWLKSTLKKFSKVHARTEKAKSETIVFPILYELKERNNDFITIFSGDSLNVDINKGLKGECDFIITKNTESYDINFPIIQVVEAKNHDLEIGVPQCAAQMVGAKLFNEKKNVPIEIIYGCVTTGDEWLFMQLGKDLLIDDKKYFIVELGDLLSTFQQIIDYYKENLK